MTSNNMCDIKDDVKDALKEFRFRKNQKNAALLLKVDREKQIICVDELIEDIQIEELQDIIPEHEPRYIVYSYKMEHSDGRISYPMCFIFYTPRDIQMELQVLYAGMKLVLQREAGLTRVYEVRELEELTEDWLKEKLSRIVLKKNFVCGTFKLTAKAKQFDEIVSKASVTKICMPLYASQIASHFSEVTIVGFKHSTKM